MAMVLALPAALGQAAAEYGGFSAAKVFQSLERALTDAAHFGIDNWMYIGVGALLLWLFWRFFFGSG